MQIETFFVAEKIFDRDGRVDVQNVALFPMACTPEMAFPARFKLPGFLRMVRENKFGDAPFQLRLDLVDEDGKAVGLPRRLLIEGVFPDGIWVYRTVIMLEFEFPGPGRFRLDITTETDVHHYSVAIELA